MSEKRDPIDWTPSCDESDIHRRDCEDCKVHEDAIHRTAAYLCEWAEAVDDLTSRAREDEEPENFLVAIQAVSVAMVDFARDITTNTRSYPYPKSDPSKSAGPHLVNDEDRVPGPTGAA